MSAHPVLCDIADMPGFNLDGPQNGISSVTQGFIEWGSEFGGSTVWADEARSVATVRCTRHGATNCVAVLDDGGRLYRCPTCNEGAFLVFTKGPVEILPRHPKVVGLILCAVAGCLLGAAFWLIVTLIEWAVDQL